MSFFQPNMLTSLSSNFDEEQWIEQIRQTLDEELEEETVIPVTIFAVPKALMNAHPDSYIPQQIAIGPYHRLRPELYHMERYKVAAAQRAQRELQNVKIHELVGHLMNLEMKTRASYHRPLSVGCEALAWMMAVDASFLLEFFQVSRLKTGKVLTKAPSRLAQLIDLSGNKTAQNAILRDITMLENQIPLFVMRMLLELELQFSSPALADGMLLEMLTRLFKELSPFKMAECLQRIQLRDCAHLLDFLYRCMVPKSEVASEVIEINEEECEGKEDEENADSCSKPSYLRQLLHAVWQMLFNLAEVKRIICSKPVKLVVKLPWKILCRTPIVSMFKEPIERMMSSYVHRDTEKKDEDEESSSNSSFQKPPLQEEIAIPSVSDLFKVGVKFLPANGGITSINFDQKALTMYIPTMVLDVNSEVILRNLVAYEACSASGPLVLTRYTELINGIVDTEADVKILCQKGIIINHLKSEKEVADLWNGMSRSIILTKVPSLDKLIADVNEYYNGRWKVKLGTFAKQYVFGSWKILTVLAAIVLLLLMSLQAFCQVYTCGKVIRHLHPNNH